MFNKIIKYLKEKKDINLIKRSGLFDKKYYQKQKGRNFHGGVRHYYLYGYKEGLSPSHNFSNDYYLKMYQDVKSLEINPLVHYLKYGKKEGRKISTDNGFSIEELYSKIYDYQYKYNIYINTNEKRRINIFFEKIDTNIKNYKNLIEWLIKYCKQKDMSLRIIYSKGDLIFLNDIINKDNLEFIELLYLKNNNYLFSTDEDIYICTSYKTLNALANFKRINGRIYVYIRNNYFDLYDKYYSIKFNDNKDIVYFSDNNVNINKYDIKFDKVGILENELIYYSNSLFVEGLELINKYLLEKRIKNVEFLINNSDYKFHFDVNVKIKDTNLKSKGKECLFLLKGQNGWFEANIVNEGENIKVLNMDEFEQLLNKKSNNCININDNVYLKGLQFLAK